MALSVGPNISDDVLGKQFKAFVEGIFSYSPQINSSGARSKSDYNGSSVIDNVFKQLTDQITTSSENAFKQINKTYEKQLKDIQERQKKIDELSAQIDEGYFDFDKELKTQQKRRLAALKSAQRRKQQPTDDAQRSIQQKLETDLEGLEKRRLKAIEVYKENLWKNASMQEKARIIENNKTQLEEEIHKLETIKQLKDKLSDEEEARYRQLVEEKTREEERYLNIQRSVARQESRATRYSKYSSEVQRIKQEQKAQEAFNKKDNANDPEARKQRSQEIASNAKNAIKTAQSIYGITASEGAATKTAAIVESVASTIAGGPSGIVSTLEGMLGKASPVVAAIMAVLKIVGSINQAVSQGIQKAVGAQTQYMGQMNARLQKSSNDNTNYYKRMIDWSDDTSKEFGLAIGEWNSFVNKTNYVEKLNELVQSGVAYNAEERALIATLSDRMVTTFDALDQSLTRLIRIQQRDMTYAALGSEALLTEFLNSQFQDTSYLNNMYDAVSGILLDATAKMSADQASAFQFEVQKWLGSLYSVGLSESGVQQLAQGITYLATGDVSQLTSNQQLQYIYAAAAERGGMSLADILTGGLDYQTTNELLKNVVFLLSDTYANSGPNTVQSAWAGITGLSISDLRSIQNINNQIASISESHATWVDSLKETENQLQLVEEDWRTSSAMKIENLINNALFSLGENVLEDEFGSGPLGIWRSLGIEGESKYLGYYLGNQLGGTIGSLLSGFSTMPALLDTLSKQFSTLQNNAILIDTESGRIIDSETGRTEEGKIDKFKLLSAFNATPLTSVLSNVSSDLIIETASALTNVMSNYDWDALRYQAGALPDEQDLSYLMPYLDSQTRNLVQKSLVIQNQENITSSTYSDFIDAVESLTPVVTSSIPDLIEQAEVATQTASTVVNESSEDRALLEEATDVQDYLFENEQTIRVTLALIEDKAMMGLADALNIDSQTKDLSDIKSTIQNKVNVDIVDDDINILLNSMDRMKWSM